MPRLPRTEQRIEEQDKKRLRIHALLRLAAPLHRLMLQYFPRMREGKYKIYGEIKRSDFPPEIYFRATTPSPETYPVRYANEFKAELALQGLTKLAWGPYRIRLGEATLPSPQSIPPLHIAAIGHAYHTLMNSIHIREENPQSSPDNFFSPARRLDLKLTDTKDAMRILSETIITVAELVGFLTYEAKSPEQAIAIIQKNLEPRPEAEARGFNSLELLSNTINGFWAGTSSFQYIPTGILAEDGMVRLEFISAVHSMRKHFPGHYHGGCPNRYTVDGQTESAITESVRIFLDQYQRSLKALEQTEKQYVALRKRLRQS